MRKAICRIVRQLLFKYVCGLTIRGFFVEFERRNIVEKSEEAEGEVGDVVVLGGYFAILLQQGR